MSLVFSISLTNTFLHFIEPVCLRSEKVVSWEGYNGTGKKGIKKDLIFLPDRTYYVYYKNDSRIDYSK